MEMKARDLRIGNLIFDHECEPHYFEVEQISKYVGSELWIVYRKGSVKTKTAEGIPLTEEWLLKFGFTFSDMIYSFDGFEILDLKQGLEFYNHDYPIKIKYVHQLQNLYYALTQTELTLTK